MMPKKALYSPVWQEFHRLLYLQLLQPPDVATQFDTTYAKIRIRPAAIIFGIAFMISYSMAVAG